jgi:hypothetical protein
MADFPLSSNEIQTIADAIKSIAFDVDRLTARLVDGVKKVKDETEKAVDGTVKKVEKAFDRVDRFYAELESENVFRVSRMIKSWHDFEKALDKVHLKYKQVQDEMKRQFTQARGPLGTAGSALGIMPQNVMGAASGFMSGAMAGIPMGGLLGLMLYGKMKDTEWQAKAYTSARVFMQVGDIGEKTTGRILGLAKGLAKQWGLEPGAIASELGSAAQAFANFGVSGAEASELSSIKIGKLKTSVLGVSFAMDTLTKVAPGTFGAAIAQGAESSGQSIQEVAEQVTGLGLSLRNTGANVGQFLGLLMQATSGLRLQRQTVGDLAEQYLTLHGAFTAGAMHGEKKQYIARSTMAGIQAVAGGVGQMSEGLSAVIGQRIGERTGQKVSGVDALIAMRGGEGLNTGGKFMGEVVRELGTLAKQITRGGTRNEQIFSLMKVAPQLGFEGARAVVTINEKLLKETEKGVSMQDAIKKHEKELATAFQSREQEQSAYQTAMQKMQLALVRIGSGMLEVTISGFTNFIDMMKALPGAIWNDAEALSTMFRIAASQAGGLQEIAGGLQDIQNLGVSLFSKTFSADVTSRAKRAREEEAANAAKNKKAIGEDAERTGKAIAYSGQFVSGIEGYGQLSPIKQRAIRSAIERRVTSATAADDPSVFAMGAALSTGFVETRFGKLVIKAEFIDKRGGSPEQMETPL